MQGLNLRPLRLLRGQVPQVLDEYDYRFELRCGAVQANRAAGRVSRRGRAAHPA
jgi:hypothetical protein